MNPKTLLAALIAASCFSAQAADFYVVVPVAGKTVSASAISVALSTTSLPGGQTYVPYSYDFKSNLQVSGDPAYNGYGVTWSATSIPSGLTLDSQTGVLSGTPTMVGTTNFNVSATYKTKTGQNQFSLAITKSTDLVLQAGGYRSWRDGTYAASCKEYRNPVGHTYNGDTGDGVYRILVGASQVNVYCDMSTDGGGWTLVRRLAPTTTTWFPVNDNLIGGQGFGTYVASPSAATNNGLAFSAIPYSEFRIASGDNARWMRFAKTELQKAYASNCTYSATISASTTSATPYATSWCFRSNYAEDPWISYQGTGATTLYGENSYVYSWTGGATAPVGGINVFIR